MIVRALHFSALAATVALALGGCSRQPPPPQAVAPCVDLKGAPCEAGLPMVTAPPPAVQPAPVHRRKPSAGKRHKRPHRVADGRAVAPESRRTMRTASAAPEAPISGGKLSAPAPVVRAETPASAPATAANAAGGASVQDQVAVATALADRITALSRLPAPNAKEDPARSDAAANRLVAVVLVKPGVKAVTELRGRVVAIDDRYGAQHNKLTAGMAAAGASDVQLLPGQATAINRLTNGEVAAAIVAVVVPEAAEAFPDIAGYRIFRVPLPTL
jgi:hypothetical protein